MKAGYRRRDLIERHTWATGLPVAPEVAEAAALTVCDRATSAGDARELPYLIGAVSPAGPAKAIGRAGAPRHRHGAKLGHSPAEPLDVS